MIDNGQRDRHRRRRHRTASSTSSTPSSCPPDLERLESSGRRSHRRARHLGTSPPSPVRAVALRSYGRSFASGRRVRRWLRMADGRASASCARRHRLTEWFYEDDECWVAECESCCVPMVVWKAHDPSPPRSSGRITARLSRCPDHGSSWVDRAQYSYALQPTLDPWRTSTVDVAEHLRRRSPSQLPRATAPVSRDAEVSFGYGHAPSPYHAGGTLQES